MPRRLCFRRHDAQLVPYQAVHQCALANVRAANNGHKASSEPLFTLSVHQLREGHSASAKQKKVHTLACESLSTLMVQSVISRVNKVSTCVRSSCFRLIVVPFI
jgi:hypothetical protein